MDNIPCGKTGVMVSELGFGGIPIIRLDEEAAVVRRAYKSGITFYDTANAYRDSEKKIGQALMDAYRPDRGGPFSRRCHRIPEDPHGARDIVSTVAPMSFRTRTCSRYNITTSTSSRRQRAHDK
jgi:hypothetical protein